MSYELIVTEKPSAAQKIADALADKRAAKRSEGGVPYYELTHQGKQLVVACAVGHLYTVAETEKGWNYPTFATQWVPSYEVSKASDFTKKYVKVLKKLGKEAESFTVATDYDIEGEVIGYNVIKYICKKKDAHRMKFSTLTKDELVSAFEKRQSHLDWGQVHAGVTRHELDWYYGINLSRALTQAIKTTGTFKLLSSGRVQGPALKMLVDKEREIKAFVPEPYWQIRAVCTVRDADIEAWHKDDKIFDEQRATQIYESTKGKDGQVSEVTANQFQQAPPHPFDLTSMQVECYRVHGIQPKNTLSIAQDLYTGGYISYPRTSSQKLPEALGYRKLLEGLKRQQAYSELAAKLLALKSLKPNEGKKTDDAHPAIYPTGIAPDNLDKYQQKVYDLIVRRFLATFATPATRETMTITIAIADEPFVAKGTRTVERGWHEFYGPYATFDEVTLPAVSKADVATVKELENVAKETKPPKRYTPASIIKELEKRNLGTKATRATIIDNLYERGYLKAKSIEVTDLGLKTEQTLETYAPRILDEELTRSFEDQMEQLRQNATKPDQVLGNAQEQLTAILQDFQTKEKEIGKALKEALYETQDKQDSIVACFSCGEGILKVKKGKFGRFLACSRYPDCSTTVSLPKTGKVAASGKNCGSCGKELVRVGSGKKQQDVCINPSCPSKQEKPQAVEGDGKPCPKCKDGVMRVRKSIYGAFLGCSNYPKCKTVVNIK